MLHRWILLVLFGPLAACSPAESYDSGECSVDHECDGGVCRQGVCVLACNSSEECASPVQACQEGLCREVSNPSCRVHDECETPARCESFEDARCVGGACTYRASPVGTTCDDRDVCTDNDACDGRRGCAGTPHVCDDPPENECVGRDSVFRAYVSVGVCLATGDCDYAHTDSPCTDCANNCLQRCAAVSCDDLRGGCQSNGVCVPDEPPSCTYDVATDGDPCTVVSGETGVCSSGQCVGCIDAGDCMVAPASECIDNDSTLVTYSTPGMCVAGSCDYPGSSTSCADCSNQCLGVCAGVVCDELNGGCQSHGICSPADPPTCAYDHAPDLMACTRVDGDGVCLSGVCVECTLPDHCTDAPGEYPECFAPECVGNVCVYPRLPEEVCAAPICAAGSLIPERVCGQDGSCPEVGQESCSPYQCDPSGEMCLEACENNDDCFGESSCEGVVCVPPVSCPDFQNLAEVNCEVPLGCATPEICSGLVMLLHFDNDPSWGESPTLAHDFSGNGNDAMCASNCPNLEPTGRFGSGFTYEEPDYFQAAPAASLSASGAVTVSAWFRPTELDSGWRVMVAKLDPAGGLSNYWMGHSGGVFALTFNDGNWHNRSTPETYGANTWYHLVGIIDNATNSQRLYVDGVEMFDHLQTADMIPDPGPVWIGYADTDGGVTGTIDEVALWNRVLSDTEIQGLYPP